MKLASKLLLAGLLLTPMAQAYAIVIDGGASWPGSANTSGSSGSGNVLNGGNTYTYPNIGNSPVENLYFGLNNVTGQGFSGDGPGVSGAEVFSWYADTTTTIEYHGTISGFGAGSCSVPDDHIDKRRFPLFLAREVLRGLIEQLQQEPEGAKASC